MKAEGYRMEKPMLVRPFDGVYQIIGGHTRHQAAQMAGLEKVLCVVEEMDDDTAILRIAQDNLNDPFSWFSQCIYVAQNSVKDSKKGLSRTALIRACTGKEGKAAENEGVRKGTVGEFLLWLEEQSLNVEGLLNPEVNLTSHLYAIHKAPEKYWQQLTELLIENEWSVKQTEAIVQSIQSHGFQPCYALLVRPFNGGYQIISGHTRHKAAQSAGCKMLPCWVKDMDDETAFMELVLANNQGELSPLEYGMHVLKYVELSEGGRGKKGGLSEYARVVGKARQNLGKYQEAATVVKNLNLNNVMQVLDKANHLAAIHKAPQPYWQTLVELLIENEWSVKQTEAIVDAIKSIDIPEHLQFWLDPDDAIKTTISECLSGGEVRTPRDIKNWVTAVDECLGILPDNRRIVTIENDRESIEYHNLQIEFLDKLPELNQGAHKPSVKKIHAMAEALLNWADTMDRTHAQWVAERADNEAKKRRIEAEKREELLNRQRFTPEGINAPLQTLKMEDIGDNFDLVLTDVPYLLSNGGDTVRGGAIVKVDKNFEDTRGQAIEPSEYMPLFFEVLKPGGYFVTTCTQHILSDLLVEGVAAGFTLRESLIWNKRNSPPLITADRFQPSFEHILVFLKPGATPYFGYEDVKLDGKQRGNVFDIPQCGGNERLGWHDTQKPLELYELLIRAYCPPEGKILEPFAGSGTTAVAAKRLGRMCTWVEQSPEFFSKAEERIQNAPFHWEV